MILGYIEYLGTRLYFRVIVLLVLLVLLYLGELFYIYKSKDGYY